MNVPQSIIFFIMLNQRKVRNSLVRLFLLMASVTILSMTAVTFIKRKEVIIGSPPNARPSEMSPWIKQPGFQIFLRMSSYSRFTTEYKKWFLPSYKYFFPSELAESSLVLALDDDDPLDHEFGKSAVANWPYPKVCYMKPDSEVDNGIPRSRMFWDNFYPEKCIQKEYVGYVDSDTLFTSMVTPNTLFKDQKPIIIARAGVPDWPCWSETTERWLGHKEVVMCMSYFPVIFKVAHIIELREYIAKRFGKSFDQVYKDSGSVTNFCLCQFSIMCNFIWYYHRDDYHFRVHMGPGNWDGKLGFVKSMASLQYLQKEFPKESWVPIPRISVHSRYIYDKDRNVLPVEEQHTIMKRILKEGRCYSAGFDLCPDKCREFNRTQVYKYLYTFEGWSWMFDDRCFVEQKRYYLEVKGALQYYDTYGFAFLGSTNKEEFCKSLS